MSDTFLPMSVEQDKVIIYEPYGSAIKNELQCDELSGSAKYICLCMKNIEDKKTFLKDVATSIRAMQRDMISTALKSKAIYSL